MTDNFDASLDGSLPERFSEAFNERDTAAIRTLVGDGAVADPALQVAPFATVSEWVDAAEQAGSRMEVIQVSPYEPLEFLARRSYERPDMRPHTTAVMRLWRQTCRWRIEVVNEYVWPDPCVEASACTGPLAPSAGAIAVSDGSTIWLVGGHALTESESTRLVALDLADTEITTLAPPPLDIESWRMRAVWAGDRVLVIGVPSGSTEVRVLSFTPGDGTWQTSPPIPGGRPAVGSPVWTGSELILAGGDVNYPDDSTWIYRPANNTWRQGRSVDAAIEDMLGVWTGDKAVFINGYDGSGWNQTRVYDPAVDQWAVASVPPFHLGQPSWAAWTGSEVLTVPLGGDDPDVLVAYNPSRDTWRVSARSPVPHTYQGAIVWTGDKVMSWGGAVNGAAASGDGAVYDIATDSWERLPRSPLTPRCRHAGAWANGVFVVMGGTEACDGLPDLSSGAVAVYDPDSRSWAQPFGQ